MLPIRDLFRCPASFEFTRNGKSVVATQRELTSQLVRLSQVTIADSGAPDEFSPIRLRPQEYRCYIYEWYHPAATLNVCVVISPSEAVSGRIVELPVRQNFAPHVPGVPVDSGEIIVELSNSSHTIDSGLGDGYYPVYAAKPLFGRPTAIAIDFKLWQTHGNIMLMDNQRFDEYGIVCIDDNPS